jgi:hypothetical protein
VSLGPSGTPTSECPFKIIFHGRFARPSKGRLILTPQGGLAAPAPSATATPLVFNLVAKPRPPVSPIATCTMSSQLYEATQGSVEIKNPFSSDAEFNVRVKVTSVSFGGKNKTLKEVPKTSFPDSIWSDKKIIRVPSKQAVPLVFNFIPLQWGAEYRADVELVDNDIGELLYRVVAKTINVLPQSKVLEKSHGTTSANGVALFLEGPEGESVRGQLNIPFKNSALEKACTTVLEGTVGSGGGPKAAAVIREKIKESSLILPLTYAVESSSNYITVPKTFVLTADASALPVTFLANAPGKVNLLTYFVWLSNGLV